MGVGNRNRPLWGGRFGDDAGAASRDFTASIYFDRRLLGLDIRGSIAHANTLARAGIITLDEASQLVEGLREVEGDILEGRSELSTEFEDIHTNVEVLLAEKLGPLAARLHTGRSRNDQVATDMHLFVKEEIDEVFDLIDGLRRAILDRARDHVETLLPGYTHMQRAQPVSFAHHLLAYFFMLTRDRHRFSECGRRADVSPLGAAALAGSGFPLDREFAAAELGFSGVYENAMDAVSDRDFVLEYLSAASLTMMHLSRLAEELVLWSSSEFGFIRLSEGYSTGSSIMPQKRNPDSAELIRGKSGRVYGRLLGLLTTMKGLPLAYNSDMQEDKEALFDATDTLKACLKVAAGAVATMEVRGANMESATLGGFLGATDAADYLVSRGVPFREAHGIVGEIVAHCESVGLELSDLGPADWRGFSADFGDDIVELIHPEGSVRRRDLPGGTGPAAVGSQIRRAKELLDG